MVSAEFALGLPAIVMVLALCLGLVSRGLAQVRCVDAAGAVARLAARGDDPAAAQAAGARVAPRGATISIESRGHTVTVVVMAPPAAPFDALGVLGVLPPPRATAIAEREETS